MLVVPSFADPREPIWLDNFDPSTVWGLLVIGLIYWVANILLSVERDRRPTRLLRFLRDCTWFLILPLIPLLGLIIQIARFSDVTLHDMFPDKTLDITSLSMLVCPLVTLFQLRKLALQIGQFRLAGQIRIVAIGDVLSLSATETMRWTRAAFRVNDLSGALVFLLPRVALMFFAIGSLYVLFEMAGHFFNLARPQRDQNESWFGPRPVRT